MLELPVHLKVLVQVGPSVTLTDVTAGKTRERDGGTHRHPLAALFRHQDTLPVGNADIAVVARSAHFQMGRAESEELETG